ncbi:HlyD family secretion protein, partial [bacterium]|nr:HlyD family secretion protein [bacterium]
MLATLEARARAANNLAELGFSIANDTYSLLGFRQTLVFEGDDDSSLLNVSGLARPTEDSPYLVWLRRTWSWLRPQLAAKP